MNQSPEPSVSLSEGFEAQQMQYRAVSKLAVATFVLGLLCITTLLDPMFWILPVIAIVLCGLALRGIARSDRVLTGRWCALWGLALAMLLGAAGPAKWGGYRWLIHQEARRVADEWWKHIAADSPDKAFQLTVSPQLRQPRDETIGEFYEKNPESAEDLREYIELERVSSLLAEFRNAGATFRYHHSEAQLSSGTRDWVSLVYTVTYENQGQTETYHLRLDLRRYRNFRTGGGRWEIDEELVLVD
ncbi:MAG: DUF4190 domain-containing protein [Planctomycetes bacterium]|nr:DUF4190 domain-containing protein [Planctomycetota bacterium]